MDVRKRKEGTTPADEDGLIYLNVCNKRTYRTALFTIKSIVAGWDWWPTRLLWRTSGRNGIRNDNIRFFFLLGVVFDSHVVVGWSCSCV